jgi:hypothetical protein
LGRLTSPVSRAGCGHERARSAPCGAGLCHLFLGCSGVVAVVKEGRKDDSGKIRMELIPPELLFATAEILTFGAAKYEVRNWEKGMSWGRVFGAMMRHLWAWWGGKGPTARSFLFDEIDAETGRSHLWHAACCLAFLIAYEERGSGTDDRFTSSPSPANQPQPSDHPPA